METGEIHAIQDLFREIGALLDKVERQSEEESEAWQRIDAIIHRLNEIRRQIINHQAAGPVSSVLEDLDRHSPVKFWKDYEHRLQAILDQRK